MSLDSLTGHYHSRIEQRLEQLMNAQPTLPTSLKDAMHYSLMAGGKRVRPFLLLATGEMLGAKQEALLDCAVALECIHTYSLIHDDLPAMDDDDLRRGKPTCHIEFDEATAILAGDALQTLAFETISHSQILSDSHKVAAIKVLSKAAGYSGMCGGQAIDLNNTGKQVAQAELEQMHQLKTGALLNASILMACEVTQTDPQTRDALYAFGQAIGLGFQVKDDILDIEGDTQLLGKPQGSDLQAHKSTYPELMGLDAAKEYLNQLHQDALNALSGINYNTQTLETFTHYLFNRNH